MKVNGVPYRKQVPNRTTLLQFLREDLKLTGTKMGCDRGAVRRLHGDRQRPQRLLVHDAGGRGNRRARC